ncbi:MULTISPECIES: DUF2007 domain-containing protein [Asticcacaulis]|uniref:putative signal transducing protein n=1 Tax=Asticcacaulis TaxID=76890 RepID=UPI001AE111B9|nr:MULTISPECIES: DUF2007 domain-containing protein [Asticcacaulis]MBP2158103.1 hypothetical protein [Asticcacaulis solisilvae]MDR6799148.1 hypothetical protein [Asticcacaulis sp. BE141]
MKEMLRTNNPVLISFVEALLKGLNIRYFVADQAVSASEGSIGLFPRRILVAPEHFDKARDLLIDAGLEADLRPLQNDGFWDD